VICRVLVWIEDMETAGQRLADLNEAFWQGLEKAGIGPVVFRHWPE
jgi:hypothetical protein